MADFHSASPCQLPSTQSPGGGHCCVHLRCADFHSFPLQKGTQEGGEAFLSTQSLDHWEQIPSCIGIGNISSAQRVWCNKINFQYWLLKSNLNQKSIVRLLRNIAGDKQILLDKKVVQSVEHKNWSPESKTEFL